MMLDFSVRIAILENAAAGTCPVAQNNLSQSKQPLPVERGLFPIALQP